MSWFSRHIGNLYSLMLNLYPRRFRDEFAEEMNVVFKDSIQAAAEDGPLSRTVQKPHPK